MTEKLSESGHWYDHTGESKYTIVGKNGKERPTTLRDARKHCYVPSVTGKQKMKAIVLSYTVSKLKPKQKV